ncbi:hypothetical protein [Flavobacterium selenitireducens]|uniref:hypothetical protein n=1 Tax=Flavobacterium selenitireducens TaxID=2722704 RepID=UPI00168AF603|nr:hypothetical protein [Flavobacterium selenitireducens]
MLAILLCPGFDFAQSHDSASNYYTAHNKGKFFVYWGGNRDQYSKSDIRFHGRNYDFTLENVTAHDKPKGIHVDYINPTRMTIPQTNFRLGYYVHDKWNVSLGVDHMKYVMTQNQLVNMDGHIEGHVPFDGTFTDTPRYLTEEFLKFEHTDGLNFISAELTRVDDITKHFHVNTDIVQLNTLVGVGGGVLYPKTNTTLMGMQRHDNFHVSGWGADLKAGLNLTFLKYFFIQSEVKAGYIDMPDIRTTYNGSDRASQHFRFLEKTLVVGGIFRL